jgi:hypothetical protein
MDPAVTDHAVSGSGIKTAVPGGSKSVTAETEIGNTLIDQHMSVGAAMNIMTNSTTFNSGSFMFMKKRPGFVCMTLKAGLLLES